MRKFLEMTEQAARDKAIKTAAIYSNMQAQALLLPASAMDAFFQRLMDDSQRRQASATGELTLNASSLPNSLLCFRCETDVHIENRYIYYVYIQTSSP